MSSQEQVWICRCDGIKTSIDCRPDKFVVFVSKTGPMHTLSFKAHTNSGVRWLRISVRSLHRSYTTARRVIYEMSLEQAGNSETVTAQVNNSKIKLKNVTAEIK